MAVFRVLLEALPPQGSVCDVPPEQARHLVRVRRLHAHERVECLDRRGWRSAAEVVALHAEVLRVRLVGEPQPPAALPRVRICVSVLPEDAFDLVLQKCTELGAAECQPLLCEHSVVRVRSSDWERKLARWQRICDEAAVQSGSAPMRVLEPMPVAAVWPLAAQVKLVADVAGRWDPPVRAQVGALVLVAIGPEGGFSATERAAAAAHGWMSWRLAHHTLRAETAAIVACARLCSG